jgi:hypothetical protein
MNPTGFDLILDWARDFLGAPLPNTGEAAFTVASAFWNSGPGGVTASIDMNRGASWVIPAQETDPLLTHEQGHFDLTALAVRDFLTQAGSDPATTWQSFFGPPPGNTGRVSVMNLLYDASSNHSQNQVNQDLWTMKFRDLKMRPDGTFAELERWAMTLASPAIRARAAALRTRGPLTGGGRR